MVLRPYFSKCGLPFTKRAASTTARSTKASKTSYKFFTPSYIPPNELVDITAKSGQGRSSKGNFKYVTPLVSIGKNYIVLNTHPGDDRVPNSNRNNQIVLKKISSKKNNKNSHLDIRVKSSSATETTLLLRRSNSANFKSVVVPNRAFSTAVHQPDAEIPQTEPEDIAQHLSDLNISNTQPINDYDFMTALVRDGKTNEVLPVFNRIRANDVVPTQETYNLVLESISSRTNSESIEDRLTHLLNVYSDMLSNDLKPNSQTYETVISALFKGSEVSFGAHKFQNGFDFFKIGLELIMISHTNKKNLRFKNDETYLLLLKGLIGYKIFDVIAPSQVYDQYKSKVSSENYLSFLLYLMQFGGLYKDSEFVHKIYSEVKTLSRPADRDTVYPVLIESLNFLGEFNSSRKILDHVISLIEDDQASQHLVSMYLSTFLRSQAMSNPMLALESLTTFNNNTWLPDVSVECLVYMASMFAQMNDLAMVNKIWDFALIRADFDTQFKTMEMSVYFPLISIFLNQYVEMSLMSNNLNQAFKCARELMVKDSLVVSNYTTLAKLAGYLAQQGEYTLSTRLVIDQGMKNASSLNLFLSSVVDSLDPCQMEPLLNSKMFRAAVEQYRLVSDNVYGIMKIVDGTSQSEDPQTRLKLKYYSKVLDYEFSDVDNCYVKLPTELTEFKSRLAAWI